LHQFLHVAQVCGLARQQLWPTGLAPAGKHAFGLQGFDFVQTSDGLTTYLGGRFGYAKNRQVDRYFAGVDPITGVEQSQARTTSYKGFQLGPTFGVDYRFHKNLSLGGEVGLMYTRGKTSGRASFDGGPGLYGPSNSTSKDTTTLLLIKYHVQ
jgi:hypothetical protein